MRLSRTALAACAAVVGLAGTLAAAGPTVAASSQQFAPVVISGSKAAPLPAGTVRLGSVPAQTNLSLYVTFNQRNQGTLDDLLAGVGNSKSPYFKDFLSSAQYGQLFGPTQAQLSQVESTLQAAGLHPGAVPADRLNLQVTGTAAAVERAFSISLTRYRLPGGRVAFANSAAPRVPGAIAPLVQGIIGLDDIAVPISNAVRVPAPATVVPVTVAPATTAAPAKAAASGPKPCNTALAVANANHAYTANALAEHYGFDVLYKLGDLGQGVRIGLPDMDPFLPSDVKSFDSCYHIAPTYKVTTLIRGVGSGPGASEASSDLENISTLAPRAAIDVYQTPNTVSNLLTILNDLANKGTDRVVVVPYGVCEAALPQTYLSEIQAIVNAAVANGQTWIVSSGDTGTTGCYGEIASQSAKLVVETPASASGVLAIGGTSVKNASPLSEEAAWNSSAAGKSGGAGGGGISSQCMPAYQALDQLNPKSPSAIPGLISSLSKTAAKCKNAKHNPQGYLRELPDVSADADYHTGYAFYWDGKWSYLFGGTSDSATLMAAEAALVDASPFCGVNGWQSPAPGLYPAGLYGVINNNEAPVYTSSSPVALYDVTRGNNDYTASGLRDGLYQAFKGYDLATGMGVPLLTGVPNTGTHPATYFPGIAAYMCSYFGKDSLEHISTKSVTPRSAPVGKGVTVTVHGSGMLEIPGTDAAYVKYNGKTIYSTLVSCPSRTACKLTIPTAYAKQARTLYVQLSPENFFCGSCQQLAPFTFKKK